MKFAVPISRCLLLAALAIGCAPPHDEPNDPFSVDAVPSAIAVSTDPQHAPGWAVRYGAERWTRPASEIDVGNVVDRVSHAITRLDPSGLAKATARTYVATFDGLGVRFSPKLPGSSDSATEVRLRTARVALGDRVLYAADGRAVPWSILGNTAQGLLDPTTNLLEHHETRGEGVELSWVLRERPTAGELVIEVAVDGLAYAGTSTDGVHLADASGMARVRIGNAMLVDAAGTRWPIAATVVGGHMSWRVDAAIIAAASFPIALDPTLSAELGMDAPVYTNSFRAEGKPSVASNGNGYFVVWEQYPEQIYGARVSMTGQIEDVTGIPLRIGDGGEDAAVASNGTDYLVVWTEFRSGTDFDIYGKRVSAAGTVLDPNGIAIATQTDLQVRASVASNGTDYLVVWDDYRGSNINVFGARVSASGAVPAADAGGIIIGAFAPNDRDQSAVASNGTDYFVVWEDTRSGAADVYGARVTAAGTVPAADQTGIPITTAPLFQGTPAVASNGTDYLVTWFGTNGAAGAIDILGARVTAAGVVADPAGIPISAAPGRQDSPAVASDGADYFVVWSDERNGNTDVYGARVTAAGAVPSNDTNGIAIATKASLVETPAITFGGTDYLVAWGETNDVYATRIATGGTIEDPLGIVVTLGENVQYPGTVASNGTGFLVAWQDTRDQVTGADIYGARMTATGAIEDVAGIAISTAPGTQGAPLVASNGFDYLVVWNDYGSDSIPDIVGARVTATGLVPVEDAAGIPISTATTPEFVGGLASNGTDYLVVWTDRRSEVTGADIYGARIRADGSIPSAGSIAISAGIAEESAPSVASDGSDYFVAWSDSRAGNANIYGARVTAAGSVPAVDAAGIPISTAAKDQTSPSVASNGTGYLVAWMDARNDTTAAPHNKDVYGARVSSAGVVADAAGLAISTAARDQQLPSVASNGTDYFVAWADYRDNTIFTDSYTGIYGARVTASGAVPAADTAGVPVVRNLFNLQTAPAVAGHAGLSYVVAYGRDYRARARVIGICGDGAIGPSESCDDGNETPGDGCSTACVAESGYTCTGAPSTCGDVNECATANGGCSQTCMNTPGSFTCGCMPGYYLNVDGQTCEDFDECLINNGGCSLLVTCTNLPGSFMCGACPSGYTGDGTTCTDVDECATNNGGCSSAPQVACTNTQGAFMCGACPSGYSGDGRTCDDIDECALGADDCSEHASCTNLMGDFSCSCLPGFTGDGRTCTEEMTEQPTDPDVDDGGCGCQSSDPRGTSLIWLALVLSRFRRRRRR